VMMMNIIHARRLRAQELTLQRASKTLSRCRLYTQIIGMISILVTALWGMYQNISIGVLG
ncbi:MAG: component of SufBCD complex, partial [Pseudomonadota bacterium]